MEFSFDCSFFKEVLDYGTIDAVSFDSASFDGGSASGRMGWRQLYESAILELNPQLLPSAIAAARRAMLDRAEEIITQPRSDEHRALNSALRTLRILEEVGQREAAKREAS